ncbi:metalloregulator ArsR/SmtB family transcription factor [Arthrobacter sp. Helios]|uniref:ArsR/SmtB family transcription factor n=1 Tax=Arthrobacter sp. Helios TaxID=2828862 RepID=UPI00204CB05F|nr:metalloregulator ArsR/SmtB family transcription factor [Arthrobacter sp. Helios]UPO77885.1 metalloregulator ArsR/SmtB family transcription factor [Arthrobacter sp. Helios]
MAIIKQGLAPLDDAATAAYAHLFQAFAEPTRLAIVQHLASGEHRVRDLVDHIGLAQSTVSKHVGFLVECGLAAMRPEGRSTWYSLTQPELLRTLIAAAENLLDATGTQATLCTHLRLPHTHTASFAEEI